MGWLLWGEGKLRVKVSRNGCVHTLDGTLGWVRKDEGGWYAVTSPDRNVIAWGPERISRWNRRGDAVRVLLSVLSDRTRTWWGEVKDDG